MKKTPYEFLREQINTTVEVYTLNNKKYLGELKGVDSCVNVQLNNAMEYQDGKEECVFLGTTVINGGNVAFFNILK